MIIHSRNPTPDFYANCAQLLVLCQALQHPKRVDCCDRYSAAPLWWEKGLYGYYARIQRGGGCGLGVFLHGFGRCCERRRQARSLRGPSAPRSGLCWLRNARRGSCTRTLSLSSIQHSNVWGQNKFQQASISQLRISRRPCKIVLTCEREQERDKRKEEGNLEKRKRKAGNLKRIKKHIIHLLSSQCANN